MKACFMFGHRNAPTNIMPRLEDAIKLFYTDYEVKKFYVGIDGSFAHSAYIAAIHVREQYPDLEIHLVLYSSNIDTSFIPKNADGCFTPPIGNIPSQYAYFRSNRYMVDTCDYFICYALYSGNSANLLDYVRRCAKKRKMYILNLA